MVRRGCIHLEMWEQTELLLLLKKSILWGEKRNKTNFAVPNSHVTEHLELYFNVSPSFHCVKEANAISWTADLDQILPAHPQQIRTCNKQNDLSCVTALSYSITAPWIIVISTPVTWEAAEEPWEWWEPVTVQPLLSVLRRGRRQEVLHIKKKKSPWNEYSSTASTVSK